MLEMAETSCQIRVLDVGCGSGNSLHDELQLHYTGLEPGRHIEMVGVDIDPDSLESAKKNYPQFLFVHAKGERLPFPDQSFDAVISRVAVPYMDIPVALSEMRRVLKPGGELRIKLHPLSFTLLELHEELHSGSLRSRVQNLLYRSYVLTNGMVFHLSGSNFHFPLARHRCESFQTQSGTRRALLAAGFQQIDTSCWDEKAVWPHAGNCSALARRCN